MKKGGRRTTAAGRSAGKSSLDDELEAILGGSDDADKTGTGSGKKGREIQKHSRSSRSTPSNLSSLTSSATDEDFYSSLAQVAGESLDDSDENEGEAMTEEDAKRMANSLAGMDDLETDLFGGSLTKKKTPVKETRPSRPSSAQPPVPGNETVVSTTDISTPSPAQESRESTRKEKSGAFSRTKKPVKKMVFGEFDEDDPLAGLLSDDDDTVKVKKSAKKKPQFSAEKLNVTEQPPNPSPALDVERPTTSRGRREPTMGDDLSPSDSRQQPSVDVDNRKKKLSTSEPESGSPRDSSDQKIESKSSALKKTEDKVNFDSGDDLPDLDDNSLGVTPNAQNKELGNSVNAPSPQKPKHPQKRVDDLFGDEDDPLDDGAKASSRFNELLGKKEKTENKKAVPKSLDDFMAKISSKPDKETSPKKDTNSANEESFHFGSYTPSAAAGSGRSRGGLARPDTAPGKRSVRFADDLGLGDDITKSSDRPATAPSEREKGGSRRRGLDLGLNFGQSEESVTKQESLGRDNSSRSKGLPRSELPGSPTKKTASPEIQSSGLRLDNSVSKAEAGLDWLGLGDEVTFPVEAESEPASVDREKALKTPPTRSPRRVQGRGRDTDGDEFLKMLGIGERETRSRPQTPNSEPQPRLENTRNESLLPWEDEGNNLRRGRQRRDQQQEERSPAFNEVPMQHDVETKESTKFSEGPDRGGAATQPEPTSNHVQSTPPKVSVTQTDSALPWERPRVQLSSTPQSQKSEFSDSDMDPTQHPIPQKILNPPAQQPTQLTQPQVQLEQAVPQPSIPGMRQQLTSAAILSSGQNQYSSPIAGLQQISDLERLEMKKLAAESRLQQSQLLEYSVTEEQYAREKSRLEEEVKLLMSRVQEMDSARQNKDLDASSRISELESKVRRLELEQEQLLITLESTKRRHQEEMTNTESAHKSHIKTLEESFQRREARLQDETELLITQHNEKLRMLDTEKSDIQTSNMRKITMLETAKEAEIERLKELHRKAMDIMRQEHEEEIVHMRKLKEQEVAAALSAHSHTKSLQSVMQQVLNSTKEVTDMRHQVESVHRSGLQEREIAAKARDEHLQQLQERLLRQQAENEEERTRLQGLISRMEIHVREQSRQLDQDRWKVSQGESRVKAMQLSLDDERRMTMEQLAAERAEIRLAKEELLAEQKRVVIQQQEERRALALERAQLATTHKELLSRDHQKAVNSFQAEADLELTAAKIKEDSAGLAARQIQVKQDEERLQKEKLNLERMRADFEQEKDRIGKLGLELQQRSRDIEELSREATQTYDEGQRAYELAERVRLNAENQRADVESKLLLLQEKERQIAQDRMAMAQERRMVEIDKQAGRCWQCRSRTSNTTSSQIPIERVTPNTIYLETPIHSGPDQTSSVPSPLPVTPDLLMNSLELKRTLRRWSADKEKDEEFLEEETKFLDKLQRTHARHSADHVQQ